MLSLGKLLVNLLQVVKRINTVKLKVGNTECPLQVCQLSRSCPAVDAICKVIGGTQSAPCRSGN